MQSASMETDTAATAALSDDMLAVVLGHLPARSLATSRGVCKAWQDLIDEHHLLLQFLLPHSVRGLFINYQDYRRSHFLSRPTSTSSPEYDGPCRVNAKFDFIEREYPYSSYEVADHCSGLVLLLERDPKVLHVCNPATRWSARLPPCPAVAACHYNAWDWLRRAFLVFDPFVSPECRVLLSPAEPEKEKMENDDACRLMEWPPSAWTTWLEFSSSSGRWEEKVFVGEGEAAGTAGDLLLNEGWNHHVEPPCRYGVYWKGALYIAAIAEDGSAGLQVWTFSETRNHMEWVPKDQNNLKINIPSWLLQRTNFGKSKHWTLDHEQQHWMFSFKDRRKKRKKRDVSPEQNVCWNSDDDNIFEVSDGEQEDDIYVKFLGFHPYKEIIFLCIDDCYAVASHLNNPKVQYLGRVHLADTYNRGIRESFVYTPCLIGDY